MRWLSRLFSWFLGWPLLAIVSLVASVLFHLDTDLGTRIGRDMLNDFVSEQMVGHAPCRIHHAASTLAHGRQRHVRLRPRRQRDHLRRDGGARHRSDRRSSRPPPVLLRRLDQWLGRPHRRRRRRADVPRCVRGRRQTAHRRRAVPRHRRQHGPTQPRGDRRATRTSKGSGSSTSTRRGEWSSTGSPTSKSGRRTDAS